MAKSVLGLDIGSKYIKYVELAHLGKDRYRLLSVGMAPLTSKGITSEAKIDQENLVKSLKKLLHDGGVHTHLVNVAFPESSVFTRIVSVPPLSDRELASAIKWEAEQYIPLPLTEVNLDFTVVGDVKDKQGDQKVDVLLVAAPKVLIERYTKVLASADLEPLSLETEIIAVSRALMPPQVEKTLTLMIVNIGAVSTDFSIIRRGVIVFTRTVPTGGDSLTRVIAQDLNLPIAQAEEYKRTYGLIESELEGKVFQVLKPIVTVIVEEIKRAIAYFQSKYAEEVISSIILSGGSAKLPGMVGLLANSTGVETQIGNPWARIEKDMQKFGRLDQEGATFVVAAGLAMREE